jgi:hypothetical protein
MADFNFIKRKERRSLLEKVVLQHSLYYQPNLTITADTFVQII